MSSPLIGIEEGEGEKNSMRNMLVQQSRVIVNFEHNTLNRRDIIRL